MNYHHMIAVLFAFLAVANVAVGIACLVIGSGLLSFAICLVAAVYPAYWARKAWRNGR